MKRRGFTLPHAVAALTVTVLLGLGGWQLGHGVYIQAKAHLAQHLLANAWDRTLATGETQKAWPWADTWPVAKLDVPKLGRTAIVLAGASGEAMAFGPGHMSATPRPGEPGTAIIAAHRDTHFAFLKDVALGDEIHITRADGAKHRFQVTGTSIVHAQASGIDPTTGGHQLALVTCYPFEATRRGPLRFVVYAQKAAPVRLNPLSRLNPL